MDESRAVLPYFGIVLEPGKIASIRASAVVALAILASSKTAAICVFFYPRKSIVTDSFSASGFQLAFKSAQDYTPKRIDDSPN